MSIRRISYDGKEKVTAIKIQDTGFIWIAFAQNTDGNCILEKQYFSDPSQVYYSLNREVIEIKKLAIDTTNIYLAYDDDSLLGEIISVNNPLTSTTEIDIPIDANEVPVDIGVDGTDLYFLLPGNASGQNAKILHYDTDGDFIETIDLNDSGSEVTNASSMAIDASGDIWILTYTSPATIVRVYQLTGGIWTYTITEIV